MELLLLYTSSFSLCFLLSYLLFSFFLCRLGLLGLVRLFHLLSCFVGLTLVIDRYLGLMLFSYCLHVIGRLLLVGVEAEEVKSALLGHQLDIGTERLPLLIHHILEIEGCTISEGLVLLVAELQTT